MYEERLAEATVEKETATERQMKQLERASEEIFRLSETVERRLQPLLQSQPLSEPSGVPKEALPPHPESIRLNTERITGAVHILQGVLSRLEI